VGPREDWCERPANLGERRAQRRWIHKPRFVDGVQEEIAGLAGLKPRAQIPGGHVVAVLEVGSGELIEPNEEGGLALGAEALGLLAKLLGLPASRLAQYDGHRKVDELGPCHRVALAGSVSRPVLEVALRGVRDGELREGALYGNVHGLRSGFGLRLAPEPRGGRGQALDQVGGLALAQHSPLAHLGTDTLAQLEERDGDRTILEIAFRGVALGRSGGEALAQDLGDGLTH
jgi:hypothetical protein